MMEKTVCLKQANETIGSEEAAKIYCGLKFNFEIGENNTLKITDS